jgi:hypothetical protein
LRPVNDAHDLRETPRRRSPGLGARRCLGPAGNSEVSSSSTVTVNGHTSSFKSKITIKDGHGHVELSLAGAPTVVRDFEQVLTLDVHPSPAAKAQSSSTSSAWTAARSTWCSTTTRAEGSKRGA